MTRVTRVALVPGVLALLPEHASRVDPVAELRASCLAAVRWLAEAGPVSVVADAQGVRVAEALFAEAGLEAPTMGGRGFETVAAQPPQPPAGDAARPAEGAVLVVANGSAKRTEKAPGHLDERAAGFDQALGTALRRADAAYLSSLDRGLAEELWVGHPDGLVALGGLLPDGVAAVDYEDDPFGVQYWVMRWG